jgi:uncharacterized protein
MKCLLTGATGFVGKKLVLELARQGHEIVVLSRNAASAKGKLPVPVTAFGWNPTEEKPPAEAFRGVDAVCHLAGEGIADKRWTTAQKKKLFDSRVVGTRHLMQTIEALPEKPKVIVTASATGFYGDRGEERLNELSAPGTGFLPEICTNWEKEAQRDFEGTRATQLRIGIVLGRDGGMMKKVLPLFKSGLAGPLGNGRQYMSWIHIDDLVGLLVHCLTHADVHGPVNGVSPHPVTNAEFTRALGKALSRPAVLPAPAFALKLALGEMSELLLGSQRVEPREAVRTGYPFKYPNLDLALADLCKKKADSQFTKFESSSGSISR